jgi:O-methyltransferase
VRAPSDGNWQPDAEILGAIVERGGWRGGSILVIARTLLELGATDRELYLFETFEGMPEQK